MTPKEFHPSHGLSVFKQWLITQPKTKPRSNGGLTSMCKAISAIPNIKKKKKKGKSVRNYIQYLQIARHGRSLELEASLGHILRFSFKNKNLEISTKHLWTQEVSLKMRLLRVVTIQTNPDVMCLWYRHLPAASGSPSALLSRVWLEKMYCLPCT